MNPNQPENKPAEATIQENPVKPTLEPVIAAKVEEQPEIKSEQNKVNWKTFREQKEQDRKARIEAEKIAAMEKQRAEAFQAALEAAVGKKNINQNEAHYDNQNDSQETDEQKIEKLVEAKIRERELRYEKDRIEREKREAPQRILEAFPDFNKICSSENCDYLDYHYPEVALPYGKMEDGFDKWAGLYRAIKKFVPNPESKQDQAKMEKNLNKPGSISSPGTSQGPSGAPSQRLSETRKAENWSRMQKTLKGVS